MFDDCISAIGAEHIVTCDNSDARNERPDSILKIIAYENMGNEQLICLSLGSQTLISRRSPCETIEVEHEIGIRFAKNKMFFIDEASGEVIK